MNSCFIATLSIPKLNTEMLCDHWMHLQRISLQIMISFVRFYI